MQNTRQSDSRINAMPTPVALVQMPFSTTAWPALSLGLLKSALKRQGIATDVHYLNFRFEQMIGFKIYTELSNGSPSGTDLLGEYIFAAAIDPNASYDWDTYAGSVLLGGDPHHGKTADRAALQAFEERAKETRIAVDSFLDECLEAIQWQGYRIVGFTSTFQQHAASLAFARRLKERHPDILIIFGGANCEGVMGLTTLRAFDFIDAVCTGEGDIAFPRFVETYLAGKSVAEPGIIQRWELAESAIIRTAERAKMDDLPYPDHDDYFAQRPTDQSLDDCRIPFETSRGCWWGQKSHCTFCGLNGASMSFRCKDGDRALEEIKFLISRYGQYTKKMFAVDNIVPHTYFRGFLQNLVAEQLDLDIFYETKANLSKGQIRLYADAGLKRIQPGIESLQSDVLQIMRKGVSALQNIRLLKWCDEFGVQPSWNYLYGFPGEPAQSYRDAAGLVPLLRHLTPPRSLSHLRFDRFSPFVSEPEAFGISDLKPYPVYSHIYPGLSDDQLSDLAYYFVGHIQREDDVDSYVAALKAEVRQWREFADSAFLVHLPAGGSTLVVDGRQEIVSTRLLDEIEQLVLHHCDDIVGIKLLEQSLSDQNVTSAQISRAIDNLCGAGYLVREGSSLLSLPVPFMSRPVFPESVMTRLRIALGLDEKKAHAKLEEMAAI